VGRRRNRRGGIYARRVEVRFDADDVFVAIGAGDVRDVPLVSIDDPMQQRGPSRKPFAAPAAASRARHS
jgi:hypothetical protein